MKNLEAIQAPAPPSPSYGPISEMPAPPMIDVIKDRLSDTNMELNFLAGLLETKINRVLPCDIYIAEIDRNANPAPDSVSNAIGEELNALTRLIGRFRVAMANLEKII